jgi:hypothetical protein
MSRMLGLLLTLVAMSVSAATETRTFHPNYKFISGFVENPLGLTNTLCGIQLPVDADCYGRLEAWVRETTPGGTAICAALLTAKLQQTTVMYRLDTTQPGQCEIVRVES